jgi:hypothetical protein
VVLRPYSGVRYLLGLLQAALVLAALVVLITALVTGMQWVERLFEGSSSPEARIERTHPPTRVEGTRRKTNAEGMHPKTTMEDSTSSRSGTRIERTHLSRTAEGTHPKTTIGETTSDIVEPPPKSPHEASPTATATATPLATTKPTSSATSKPSATAISTPTASATPSAALTSSGVSASPRERAGTLPGSGGAPVLPAAVGILLVGAGIVGAMRACRTS